MRKFTVLQKRTMFSLKIKDFAHCFRQIEGYHCSRGLACPALQIGLFFQNVVKGSVLPLPGFFCLSCSLAAQALNQYILCCGLFIYKVFDNGSSLLAGTALGKREHGLFQPFGRLKVEYLRRHCRKSIIEAGGCSFFWG